MEKLLPLIGPVLFQITSQGDILSLTQGARVLLEKVPDGSKTIPNLFGVADYSELRTNHSLSESPSVEVRGSGGSLGKFKWEYSLQSDSVLASGINWRPVEELVDALSKEVLLFREVIVNLLPSFVVDQVRQHKTLQPKAYRECTIAFLDVVSFSRIAFHLDPVSLIKKLDEYYSRFDHIVTSFSLAKIKTIGDAYMLVGGIPQRSPAHAVDACLAGLHLIASTREPRRRSRQLRTIGPNGSDVDIDDWQFRMGLHSGPCITGVLGSAKYLFDVWGDSVNIAARMEGASEPGRVTVSGATYELIKGYFSCTSLGRRTVKNAGEVDVYRVDRLRPELSADALGFFPNSTYLQKYIQDFGRNQTRAPAEWMPPFYQPHLALLPG